jgi:hypothetical protein
VNLLLRDLFGHPFQRDGLGQSLAIYLPDVSVSQFTMCVFEAA